MKKEESAKIENKKKTSEIDLNRKQTNFKKVKSSFKKTLPRLCAGKILERIFDKMKMNVNSKRVDDCETGVNECDMDGNEWLGLD